MPPYAPPQAATARLYVEQLASAAKSEVTAPARNGHRRRGIPAVLRTVGTREGPAVTGGALRGGSGERGDQSTGEVKPAMSPAFSGLLLVFQL
uniref:Uncharacterized protein n=1 Tax=Streptomyces avermitilis TaxID=33903 RepID=A0A499VDS6_STRAX|nr:hypothetical protein SAVMC3_51030 [Streptomyces avermitilis]